MDPVVFLGPSLDRAVAARTLDAEFLPPIVRGDIDALLARPHPPCVIGIVDGRFLDSLAVSPKEVLRAVDAGIPVYGSSSMGALRAAECAPFGVTGVGRIYDAYASGAVDADDEVAIVYDPDTLCATSEPLINLRFAIEDGVAEGEFGAAVGERFLAVAKSLHFPDRTVANVLRGLAAEGLAAETGTVAETAAERDRIAAYFADRAPDTKAEDALALLGTLRDHIAAAGAPAPPEPTITKAPEKTPDSGRATATDSDTVTHTPPGRFERARS
ncbi:TfuA-like protein [Streptomyces varsoviensis]|uniref:TfuA-like protein n=1 Tax=Streptomyces varsoviensis TaxID=67373 RepID=UPI0007C5B302|nr:TfuA-like protein [Streptomyces varsoviensis]